MARASTSDNTILIIGGIAVAFYLYSSGVLANFSLSSLLPAALTPAVVANPVIANAISCAVGQALSSGYCYQCPPGNTVQGQIGSQYCVAPNE